MNPPPNRYFFAQDEVKSASKVRIFEDGPDIFARMFSLLESARKKIAFEFYMFRSDGTGKKVRDALVAAGCRGVNVRLIFDSFGSWPTDLSFFEPLIRAGGEVAEYHPVRPWQRRFRISRLGRRNHRKLLLVDDDQALLGGYNIADEYFRPPEKGGVHDLALELIGPAVSDGWELFERSWNRVTGGKKDLLEGSGSGAADQNLFLAQIIGSEQYLDRWKLRRRFLYAIARAEQTIDMMNPYFLPAKDVLHSLRKAVKRGIRVRLVVPETSDVRAVDLASTITQQRLLKFGIEIYKWPGNVHAKAILVDGVWFSVGSYNLDYQSLFRNLEIVANVYEPECGGQLQRIFDDDVGQSRLVTSEDWKKLAMWRRILARLLYRLRRFL